MAPAPAALVKYSAKLAKNDSDAPGSEDVPVAPRVPSSSSYSLLRCSRVSYGATKAGRKVTYDGVRQDVVCVRYSLDVHAHKRETRVRNVRIYTHLEALRGALRLGGRGVASQAVRMAAQGLAFVRLDTYQPLPHRGRPGEAQTWRISSCVAVFGIFKSV